MLSQEDVLKAVAQMDVPTTSQAIADRLGCDHPSVGRLVRLLVHQRRLTGTPTDVAELDTQLWVDVRLTSSRGVNRG